MGANIRVQRQRVALCPRFAPGIRFVGIQHVTAGAELVDGSHHRVELVSGHGINVWDSEYKVGNISKPGKFAIGMNADFPSGWRCW